MQATASRVDVRTADGGTVVVWVEGDGPALVMVPGSMCDHTTFDGLVAELRGSVTTFAIDRRGFGASSDGDGYSADREFDDVAAVVARVAERTGGPVDLFGHSWGASVAMGAAARSGDIRRLVLYEPSLGLRYPPGVIDRIEALVAAGDAEGAVLAILVDLGGMTDEEVDLLRSGPLWPSRLAAAPTIAREARIEDGWVDEPGQWDAITAPTLLLTGSESPADLVDVSGRAAAAIGGARTHTLAGHGHFAYRTHPAEVAPIILGFVR